jgi:RNA polymerase sigma factor (sigma-70 family)
MRNGDGGTVSTYGGTAIDARRAIPSPASDLSTLVKEAADGNNEAWVALVDRFSGLVWSVARSYRLRQDDAAEVVQTTWLRLVEHLGDIREPERVGAWLATTARRLSLATIRHSDRDVPTDFLDSQLVSPDQIGELDAALDARHVRTALQRAVEELPEPGRALLRVLSADPAPSYAEVAAALDMPIGSIGPTRARSLERLRRSPHLAHRRSTADTLVAC